MPANAFLQSEQTVEIDVSGPGDTNKLFIVNGLADFNANASSPAGGSSENVAVTVEAHIGPELTTAQFRRGIATASLAHIRLGGSDATFASWEVRGVDADYDDDASKVQFQCDVRVGISPGPTAQAGAVVGSVGFQVIILAAVSNQ